VEAGSVGSIVARVDPNQPDRFLLRQRIAALARRYEFSLLDEDGTEQEPFCFVYEPRLKFTDEFGFFTDDSRSVELMRAKEGSTLLRRGIYDVTTADGTKIGEFEESNSPLRTTYQIRDAEGNAVARLTEKSWWVTLTRSLGVFGLPFPDDFAFKRDETTLGLLLHRRWKLRDTYEIDMTADPGRTIDRRLVLAVAVALDAIEDAAEGRELSSRR
jgi:uncharacterized protein YxjI